MLSRPCGCTAAAIPPRIRSATRCSIFIAGSIRTFKLCIGTSAGFIVDGLARAHGQNDKSKKKRAPNKRVSSECSTHRSLMPVFLSVLGGCDGSS